MRRVCYTILSWMFVWGLTICLLTNIPCRAFMDLWTYIEGYEEYLEHINNNTMPTDFVSFSDINYNNELTFCGFQFAKKTNDFGFYEYSLGVGGGGVNDLSKIIDLRVNHAGHHQTYWQDFPIIELPSTMDDMRDMPINERSVIYIDGIQYTYLLNGEGKARLYQVTYVIDEIEFRWTFNSTLEFPNEQNTFIEKLLHASTATQARDEFATSIRGELKSEPVEPQSNEDGVTGKWILYLAIPALVIVLTVVFFVVRKKKRAKA